MKPCIHNRQICYDCLVVSDAAKRAYNIINSYVAYVPWDQLQRSWVAIRLEDGGSDGTLYESKRDAIRHQPNEFQCAYFSYQGNRNGFANVKHAQIFLDAHRALYDKGIRMVDPDDRHGGRDFIMPLTYEDQMRQLAELGVKNRTNFRW